MLVRRGARCACLLKGANALKPKPNLDAIRKMDEIIDKNMEAIGMNRDGTPVDPLPGPDVPPDACKHCGKDGEWSGPRGYMSGSVGEASTNRVTWRHSCGEDTTVRRGF